MLCLPASLPLLVIARGSLSPEASVWAHLARYVLPEVVANTVKLVIGVAILGGRPRHLARLADVRCANSPAGAGCDWALLLPLAIPAYVLAFVAVGFLDYAGPLQACLRAAFGSSAWFPPIRSTGGVIFVLSLAFYPYVYLLARSAFLTQGRRALEVAQTLGHSRSAATWRVAIPMARPWIAAGIALVCMETLADFGAVSIFNYNTFTTAIYRAWFGMFSVHARARAVGGVDVVRAASHCSRPPLAGGVRFASTRDMSRESPRSPLSRSARWLASRVCRRRSSRSHSSCRSLQLLWWTDQARERDLDARYWAFTAHSLFLAASAALVIVAASLTLAYLLRRPHSTLRGHGGTCSRPLATRCRARCWPWAFCCRS